MNAELMPPRFIGDGRFKIVADKRDVQPSTQPATLTRGQCRQFVEMLYEHKSSNHSGQGATLWVGLEFCRVNNITHRLTVATNYPDGIAYGYRLEL